MRFYQTINFLCVFRKPNPCITIQKSQFKSFLEERRSENVVGNLRKIIGGIKKTFLKEWYRLEDYKETVENINSKENKK